MLKVRATPTREGAVAYRPTQGREAIGGGGGHVTAPAVREASPLVVRNWLVAAKRS